MSHVARIESEITPSDQNSKGTTNAIVTGDAGTIKIKCEHVKPLEDKVIDVDSPSTRSTASMATETSDDVFQGRIGDEESLHRSEEIVLTVVSKGSGEPRNLMDTKEGTPQEARKKYVKLKISEKKKFEKWLSIANNKIEMRNRVIELANRALFKIIQKAKELESQLEDKEKQVDELESQLQIINSVSKEDVEAWVRGLNEGMESSIQVAPPTYKESGAILHTDVEAIQAELDKSNKIIRTLLAEVKSMHAATSKSVPVAAPSFPLVSPFLGSVYPFTFLPYRMTDPRMFLEATSSSSTTTD